MSEMEILYGKECDLDSWMQLVEQVSGDFPGLETEEALKEHRDTVLRFMGHDSAICAKIESKIVGTLLISKEDSMLCFLAVDPAHRRQHIAERMVSFALALMEPDKNIVVTTYREGVPEGIAARAFYKRMGFSEGKLTEEFGSPVQEFVLRR
ncbi:MAG: GNAT family N-acetyltransferase [Bariatricus sp.]